MPGRLILHIGLRKTGSSALQELLSKNGDLLSQHKLDYPARLSRFPAHQELAWALDTPRPYHDAHYDPDVVYGHFAAVVEGNADKGISTILSSEDLSLLTFRQDQLIEVARRFSDFQPEIVFFRRDPVSYHISNYKHALFRERETRPFAEYVFKVYVLCYAHRGFLMQAWGNAFGHDRVIELPYARATIAQESILSRFLRHVFDIRIEDTFANYRSNTSIPDCAVPYVRALNASDYPEEALAAVKEQMRSLPLSSSEEAFLAENLTSDERAALDRLYG
ncbi:MAG: hypothetical protein AAFR35_14655 [Pseudomonadota bacterium]